MWFGLPGTGVLVLTPTAGVTRPAKIHASHHPAISIKPQVFTTQRSRKTQQKTHTCNPISSTLENGTSLGMTHQKEVLDGMVGTLFLRSRDAP